MKIRTFIIITLLLINSGCYTLVKSGMASKSSFIIKETETGRIFGPYETKLLPPHGLYQMLYIPLESCYTNYEKADEISNKYIIDNNITGCPSGYVTQKEVDFQRRLSETRISHISLRRGSISELLDVMQRYMTLKGDKSLIQIITDDTDPAWDNIRPISFSMTNVSIIDVLEYMREVYNINYLIEEQLIYLNPRK